MNNTNNKQNPAPERSMKNHAILKTALTSLTLIAFSLSTNAQQFKTVWEGIGYAEMTREIGGKAVRMNLLRLDPFKVRLDVAHAKDTAVGVEETSSIARRHGAIAAVNAGFFRLDNSLFAGDAAGILQIDGELWSESYADRIALLISNRGQRTRASIAHVNATVKLDAGRSKGIAVEGINREIKENEMVVYTPVFSRTTLTGPGGVECLVRNGKIRGIHNRGSAVIPSDGFVISASGSRTEELRQLCKAGSSAVLRTDIAVTDKQEDGPATNGIPIEEAEDIVNGVPQLIRNGKPGITWEAEKTNKAFVENLHPRTAAAVLDDGGILLITVDGRSEESAGISLPDLAAMLLEFGAVQAINLDGGGSTTMYVDGRVVNKPSDKEGERRVSDALLVFPRH